MLHPSIDLIYEQFSLQESQEDLRNISSDKYNWQERVKNTLDFLLPLLPDIAQDIKTNIPKIVNSPLYLSNKIIDGKHIIDNIDNIHLQEWYRGLLVYSQNLSLNEVFANQISNLIEKNILNNANCINKLKKNSLIRYPDLIFKDAEYSGLEKQNKYNPISGPCINGESPSNVPDGLEIKTKNSKNLTVDAHAQHIGLHLGVTWGIVEQEFTVHDVLAGYISKGNYKESMVNVRGTTKKYSLRKNNFFSLL
jgi:hypothetical protein